MAWHTAAHRQAWRTPLGAGALAALFGAGLLAAPSGCFLDTFGVGSGGATSTGGTTSTVTTSTVTTSTTSTTSTNTGSPLGTACTTGAACASGQCVSGVCCSSACSGTCQACLMTLTGEPDGMCTSILAKTPAPMGQCTAAPPCGNTGNCAAGGLCEQASSTTSCGPATCTGSTLTPEGLCNGTGSCVAGVGAPCPNDFACGAGACKTACSASTDCASGYYCPSPGPSGTCAPQLANGTACTGLGMASECAGGWCYGTPTVCQPNSCNDDIQDGTETGPDCGGATCDAAGKTCGYNKGCQSGADCTSGVCAGTHLCLCTAATSATDCAPFNLTCQNGYCH
jgi:hypothetical protein